MLSWRQWSLLASLTLALVSATVSYSIYSGWEEYTCLGLTLTMGTVAVSIVLALIAWDIGGMGPADSYSFTSLLLAYVSVKFIVYRGQRWENRLKRSWVNSVNVQRQLLMNILAVASKTKYGREKHLDEITSVAEFRKAHPVSTYETYANYVDDILDGGKDVMFPGQPFYFSTTSGTTGKHKVFPKTKHYFTQVINCLHLRGFHVLYRENSRKIRLKKVIMLQTYHRPAMTNLGVGRGPASAMLLRYYPMLTLPEAGFRIPNTEAAFYVNLVFSLIERDVVALYGLFSPGILGFFQKMEMSWKEICGDIEFGVIRDGLNIPEEELRLLNAELKPNPRRAQQLRDECLKGFNGIAKRIWPQMAISFGMSTGVFMPAASVLASKYLKGVPNFSRIHVGTEAIYGVNRNVFGDDIPYTLLSSENFYELLPLDSSDTILPEEAKIGKLYELVVTTAEGLYRYRTTDVIEAINFQGTALVYKFCQRFGDFLYLRNEKTPVSVVNQALQSALRAVVPLEIIADFACTESLNVDRVTGATTATRYWIFVELYSGNVLPNQFVDKVEEILRSSLASYANHRDHQTAYPVKVVSLTTGTFKKLRAQILKEKPDTSIAQFKTPRVTRQDGLIRIFLENVNEEPECD